MKNIGLTLLMFLFVGVGTSMAQDKKVDSDAAVKTEVKSDSKTAKHSCAPGCKSTSCAKKTEKQKKACAADCKKDCCADKTGKQKKACAADCKKDCCAKKKEDAHEGHGHGSHEGHNHGTPN